jgi:hypothetical protein
LTFSAACLHILSAEGLRAVPVFGASALTNKATPIANRYNRLTNTFCDVTVHH